MDDNPKSNFIAATRDGRTLPGFWGLTVSPTVSQALLLRPGSLTAAIFSFMEEEMGSIEKMKDCVAGGVCTFCGESQASGYWHGMISEVLCCCVCATEILPKFIADSCYPMRRSDVNRILDKVRAEFLYSAALNAMKG